MIRIEGPRSAGFAQGGRTFEDGDDEKVATNPQD
jgi:hypothetical protein